MTFDAATPGTPAETWSRDPRLHTLPTVELSEFDALVVLAAHPDDETLGAGGTLARAAREGLRVTVVCVTDGAASHPMSEVAPRRAAELRRALQSLGLARPPMFLDYPDGAVRENRAAIARRLGSLLADTSANTLVLSPWTGDGHRDHRVLGEIAVEASLTAGTTLWQYPIWMWHWGAPDHPDVPWNRFAALPLAGGDRRAALAASAAYESQRESADGGAPILHEGFLAHFDRAVDYFVV